MKFRIFEIHATIAINIKVAVSFPPYKHRSFSVDFTTFEWEVRKAKYAPRDDGPSEHHRFASSKL